VSARHAGPSTLPDGKLQLDHCLVVPQLPGYRIKVVQVFRKNWASSSLVLDSVELHKEKYDGPYTGKRELAGCGGGQPPIAKLPALQADAVAGSWSAVSGTRYVLGGNGKLAPSAELPSR
jgi:hypothetical protein